MNNDPLGKACIEYLKGWRNQDIVVHSDHSEDDIIPVDYLFRSYDQMPITEQVALDICTGSILDIGAGSGCHSIHLLLQGKDVRAIDTSKLAVKAMNQRGLMAEQIDFFNFDINIKFDTVLALMNGTGIGGTLFGFEKYLLKLKSHLNKKGQI